MRQEEVIEILAAAKMTVYPGVQPRVLVDGDMLACLTQALEESQRRALEEAKALAEAVHKAKGRYHNQIAMCDLYDHFNLPNVRPVKDAK